MEEISIKAEELFFGITNSLALSIAAFILLVVLSYIISKKIKLVPGKLQSLVEIAVEKLLGLMEGILGSREKAEKYFPFIATIFIFILTCNILGIFPGVGSLVFENAYHKEVPFFRSPASDLNFTLAIAIISVIITNVFGIISLGFFKHISKFINFKDPISFFIGILELISEVAKIISLSFRLFGNVFAGEVLLIIIFFLVPYAVPVPFLMLELFVGFIQAFVFSTLTLVSIALHTAGHDEEKGHS
jgi:F-type H+-transporting ATPase subunit a